MSSAEQRPAREHIGRCKSTWVRRFLILIGAMVSLPVIASGEADEQALLIEFLKDAQATNLASLEQGRLVAQVRHRPSRNHGELKLDTTVLWNRNATLWIYKLSDPDKLISPNNYPYEWGADLTNQHTSYRMITNKTIYTYDPFDGTLMVIDYGKPVGGPSGPNREYRLRSFVFDVLPESNWFRCCAPNHDGGRPWVELIGPDSPALMEGAELTVVRSADGLIRQTRKDPDGGVFETVFSPEFCGNVVEVHYRGTDPHVQSFSGWYEWRMTQEGVCVLLRSVFEKSYPGQPTKFSEKYTIDITSIDLKADVGPERVSFNALKAYLPPNTEVYDRGTGKSYRLNPMPGKAQNQRFRQLAKEARSKGFLNRGK